MARKRPSDVTCPGYPGAEQPAVGQPPRDGAAPDALAGGDRLAESSRVPADRAGPLAWCPAWTGPGRPAATCPSQMTPAPGADAAIGGFASSPDTAPQPVR